MTINHVLGIETSCDETAVALYSNSGLIAHHVYSQIPLHREWGGVVPELASRDHVRKLLPLVNQIKEQYPIDAIAYTQGPGLIGALLVGASLAKTLGFAWRIPTLGVHHMEAHLMAVMLDEPKPTFPFVALLISGGHSQIVYVEQLGHYQLLGESIDDAAGEAFDKTAKLMGLPYPGGPELAKLAAQGDANAFDFPRPMCNRPGFSMSFSGLKTAVRTALQDDAVNKADVAASFQAAVVDTLLIKAKRALQQTNATRLVMVGGVSANQYLREEAAKRFSTQGVDVFYPKKEFCTDNGAMVAYLGWLKFQQGQCDADLAIRVKTRCEM